MKEVESKCIAARAAAVKLATLGTAVKDKALLAMADAFEADKDAIFAANKIDLAAATPPHPPLTRGGEGGLSGAMLKRLTLDDKKVAQMAEGVRQIAALRDPIGETLEGYLRPNGMEVRKVRVPIGVIGIIYESRPNVTADAAALCLKAGNAVILRGGSEAIHSNLAIAKIIQDAITAAGVPEGAVQIIETTDREAARELMTMKQYIDCLIPRGGKGLIQTVVQNSTIPVIEHGDGNCHVYVDGAADLAMAADIAFNAKVQNCSVCNAAETLLVSEHIAREFLPTMCKRFADAGVEIRGCEKTRAIVPGLKVATEEDWETEYLDLILAVKVVSGLDEAIEHIAKFGSRHSEAIVTEDYSAARKFTNEVDAAAVYVNVSTRFTDGYEFGKGAEMGISTQKLHARGPMGVEEITTYKYVVTGNGQLRF
jgi:glutamate-5-semialdehyde dehydrogenase